MAKLEEGEDAGKRDKIDRREGEEERREVKKRGRPTNVEKLGRERVFSTTGMESIEEIIGRKGREEERKREFQRSRRIERTPEKKGRGGVKKNG